MAEKWTKELLEEHAEGLRARKKRETRQLISDVATEMFLEHGFNAMKVSEVAKTCGVSEKTVYNYFPTKESLLLDREETMATAIRLALGPEGKHASPVEAALEVLANDLQFMRRYWDDLETPQNGLVTLRRFVSLVAETPSLRSAQFDMMARLARIAAEAMAARAGIDPDDPEPQVAAAAILSLWTVQFRSLNRYADGTLSIDEVISKTTDDVRRAALLLESGLWSFGAMVQGSTSRAQLKAAADAAQRAAKQVATALKNAHSTWHDNQSDLATALRRRDEKQSRRKKN